MFPDARPGRPGRAPRARPLLPRTPSCRHGRDAGPAAAAARRSGESGRPGVRDHRAFAGLAWPGAGHARLVAQSTCALSPRTAARPPVAGPDAVRDAPTRRDRCPRDGLAGGTENGILCGRRARAELVAGDPDPGGAPGAGCTGRARPICWAALLNFRGVLAAEGAGVIIDPAVGLVESAAGPRSGSGGSGGSGVGGRLGGWRAPEVKLAIRGWVGRVCARFCTGVWTWITGGHAARISACACAAAPLTGRRTGYPWAAVTRGYSSAGRAPALQAGGQGFESP